MTLRLSPLLKAPLLKAPLLKIVLKATLNKFTSTLALYAVGFGLLAVPTMAQAQIFDFLGFGEKTEQVQVIEETRTVPLQQPDIGTDLTDKIATEPFIKKTPPITVKKQAPQNVDKATDKISNKRAEILPKKVIVAPEPDNVKPAVKPRSYIGGMQIYVTDFEDTLLDVARRFDLGFVELQSANPTIDPWVPGQDTKVIIPSMHLLPDSKNKGILVNLGDMRLYQFDARGAVVKSYPIGVGREGMHTPLGSTTVVKKKAGPWWFPTARMREEDPSLPRVMKQSSSNPLGTHGIYLGWPTYAIHGTSEPWGIGRRVSSGCLRMYPEDIPVLFEETPVGTYVRIVDQTIKTAWVGDNFMIEAHPEKNQATAFEYEDDVPIAMPNGIIKDMKAKIYKGSGYDKETVIIDWRAVRRALTLREGYPISVAVKVAAGETADMVVDKVKDKKDVKKPSSSTSRATQSLGYN